VYCSGRLRESGFSPVRQYRPPAGQNALFTYSLATFSVSPLSMHFWLTGASRSAFASAGPQHAGMAAERTFRGIFCAS
jgi:hypothetical protein